MSGWTEEQQEQYEQQQEQGNEGGSAPKGSAEWAGEHSGENAPGESKETPKTDVAPEADELVGVSGQNKPDAVMGYDEQIAALQTAANRYKPETEEERSKRERREKSQKIVAAVTDGLQALGNLYFTSRGAPNMYDYQKTGQLAPLQDRLERLRAERQANADKYLQYSLKVGDLRNERAKTVREMEEQQERMKQAREKAQREQEAHGWLAALQPDKQREQAGKATKAEQEAITAEEEAKNAPALYKEKVKTERNRGRAYVASATNSYASANEHNTNAQGRYQWWDENGNMHYAKTESEAITKARQHGTLDSETVDTTDNTDSDVVVRGRVTGAKKNTMRTTSKKVFYPGIRKKPAAEPQAKPAAKPSVGKRGGSSGSGKHSGFSIYK